MCRTAVACRSVPGERVVLPVRCGLTTTSGEAWAVAESLDAEWARDVLDSWIRVASPLTGPDKVLAPLGAAVNELRAREHQTRMVVQRILGTDTLPQLIGPILRGRFVVVQDGVDLVRYARGVLDTQEETAARLGTSAPLMAADGLHPIAWGAAAGLWSDGHFGHAVQRAATFLNAHVQDRLDRHDVSDAALMQQAFSPNVAEAGKPRLRWAGADDDLTVKAMRAGILNFSQGCFMAIRNPATHGTDDLPRQVALEHLAVLSTLARWIDGCDVVAIASEKG